MTNKKTLKGVIDRFEGEWVVTEIAGETEPRNILRSLLPEGAKEGDHLQIETEVGEIVQVQLDDDATQESVNRIQDKLERLRRGDHLQDDV